MVKRYACCVEFEDSSKPLSSYCRLIARKLVIGEETCNKEHGIQKERDYQHAYSPVSPGCLSPVEVLDTSPYLMLPCPLVPLRSKHESHDEGEKGDGNEDNKGYPDSVADSPYPT